MTAFWLLRCEVWVKFTDVEEVLAASIIPTFQKKIIFILSAVRT
jgi:hypothetical protein